MIVLRRLLGDRPAACLLAGLAVYFLLVQAFIAGFACASAFTVGGAHAFVLCGPDRAQSASAVDEDGSLAHFAAPPCGLCLTQAADLPEAVLGADLGPLFTRAGASHELPRLRDAPAPRPVAGRPPAPRGPPFLSA